MYAIDCTVRGYIMHVYRVFNVSGTVRTKDSVGQRDSIDTISIFVFHDFHNVNGVVAHPIDPITARANTTRPQTGK